MFLTERGKTETHPEESGFFLGWGVPLNKTETFSFTDTENITFILLENKSPLLTSSQKLQG